MKRLSILMASAVLCGGLVISDSADAYYRGVRGAGWHGAGWHRTGWHRTGWHRAGWRSARWHGARWRSARWGWGGNRWGWNNGWGPGLAGTGLGLAGLGVATATSPFWGWNSGWNSPYYGYNYPYGYSTAMAESATAPLVTGRSVATGSMGNYCTTPAKTCLLTNASWVGNGCSCRVPGGHARGSVTP